MLNHPVTFAHGSFAFNAHRNADGSMNQTYVSNTVTIDNRTIDPSFRDGRDAYHLGTGGSLGRAHKGMKYIRLDGRIIGPIASQEASVADKERAMLAAFDPELCYRDSPTTDGAYAFDFFDATTDTTTYTTGLIPSRYYVRPAGSPQMTERLGDAGVRRYALALIAADPRCYEQTEQTLVLTPASATGSVVNRGTVPSPLRATILMAGAGASNFTITRGGVAFVLNLSTATTGQSIVVVMETCGPYGRGRYITKAGVEAFSLKTSAATTWLDAPVGTTSFVISNHTNVTSCTLAWYSARA
jgi:hypothetical protein